MPAKGAMWINDWDVWGSGFVVETPEGFASSPTAIERTTRLPHRVGSIPLAREEETTSREIIVQGVIKGSSLSDVYAKIDELNNRLFNGAIEVRFGHATDRMVLARCSSKDVIAVPPAFASVQKGARVTVRLFCPDPLIYAKLGMVVGFTATKQFCPLGTAVSYPMIRIAGAVTNPTLTYRDFRGASKKTMGFTVTLASNEYLEIDSERAVITKVTAGVSAAAMSTWTSGDFFDGLDPQDADVVNSVWPTLEISPTASCEAMYRKAWL